MAEPYHFYALRNETLAKDLHTKDIMLFYAAV